MSITTTGYDAYITVAGEMYIPGEVGYQTPAEVLLDLEPEIVALAERHAKANDLPWPPRPLSDYPVIYGWSL